VGLERQREKSNRRLLSPAWRVPAGRPDHFDRARALCEHLVPGEQSGCFRAVPAADEISEE
jgi:hypothetical protein